MTEQQNHLQDILNQQKELVNEINEINRVLTVKREQFLKLQGVVEYLNQIGIILSRESENQEVVHENSAT